MPITRSAMPRVKPRSSLHTNMQAAKRPMCSCAWRNSKPAAGNDADASATLERINYIYPVNNVELHRQLGDLLFAQKQYDGAIREYNALVASNPVDKAGAEFDLAQAYFAAGQKNKAQDSVLAALETAPDYRPAQKLLLELQSLPAKSN